MMTFSTIYSLEMPNGVYRFCIDPKNRIPSYLTHRFQNGKENLRLKINVNYEACLGGIQMVIPEPFILREFQDNTASVG